MSASETLPASQKQREGKAAPAVFIHGVPDTFRVWDFVHSHLSRPNIITLALPGFDSPLPPDFKATKDEYASWIIEQLEQIGTPVDLVGHDWGCILAMRVVSLRPDLVQSWAVGSGPINKNYEWHPLAKIWQTPGEGEKWMKELDPSALAKFMNQAGLPIEHAQAVVSRIDERMGRCILGLYRSARDVGSEWQPELKRIRTPGLIFWGLHETACPVEFADRLAADTRAKRVLKLDCNHWTIVERGAEVAHALEEHWACV